MHLGFSNSKGSKVVCAATSPYTITINNFDGFSATTVRTGASITAQKYVLRFLVEAKLYSQVSASLTMSSTTFKLYSNL